MKRSLKQSIVDKFDSVKLDSEQLATLEDQLATHQSNRLESHSRRNWLTLASIAAVLVLAVIIPFGNDAYRDRQTDTLVSAIALEVANNHLKLKPLEVESSDLTKVLNYFDKLDFDLVETGSITGNPGDRLLGGRYCTIQGIDAAQLRVKSRDGKLSTWYEGILPAEKLELIPNINRGEVPAVRAVKGLQVRVWQEQGVVFVEAKN